MEMGNLGYPRKKGNVQRGGRDMRDGDEDSSSDTQAGPKFCTNCGSARDGDYKFCTNCGTALDQVKIVGTKKTDKPKNF
jgi:hypothetical protein